VRLHSQKKKGLNNYVMCSYCLSTRISTARTGRISFTFGTGEVKIWLNREKALGTSNENITFVDAGGIKTPKKMSLRME